MDSDTLESFYENLGFELVEIDDRDTLFYQISDDGEYATITDDNGNVPGSLEEPIIFTLYDENDSFQWSVTIEDSHYFGELFTRVEDTDELLSHLQGIRQENIARYDEEV
ncbi:hypothetical protein [uncultured Veillonella sp.]|uniref:hypothetical protein n=1 Tax=uncultured Veillonella sp. TaxID=159268 RepID=UPI0025DB5202|nr:hypothetical protein [uncultured Veillonella sp.]MDY3973289.1 hypothetical protein [Veillonella caviae]